MGAINQLENTIGGWLKPLPHLPVSWSKWLANNAWWLTLIGVILSVFGIIGLAYALMLALTFFGAASTFMSYYHPATTYSTWWIGVSVLSFALLVITTILEAMAISPLKALKKRGWDLMFIIFLIGVVTSIISAFATYDAISIVPSVLTTVVSTVISAYILFEVRSYFKPAVGEKK